ncbi:MAG: prephenate dehydrogenase/arogenate dehydrogenase family protein [Armatimonadetes bacterium]|jgi:prephenate dehydrogenase|nr:prephenate dehydrogenase/arogenate dehydrogenase family protein [Armatimonadota bacterium]
MDAGIIGLGLIGSSLGLALRRSGLFDRVVGYDLNERTGRQALGFGCVDSVVHSIGEAARCGRVFVAVPPSAVRPCLDAIEAARTPETLVSDCVSVKGTVADWVAAKQDRAAWTVGGHPMAGNEGQGPEAADEELFRGATWVLVPFGREAPVDEFDRIVRSIGARPVVLGADEHDRAVAVTSHLPHILASCLVHTSADLGEAFVSAGSWRDLTRVAGANPPLWQQILVANRRRILAAMDEMERQLTEVRSALEANDAEAVRAFLEEARQLKLRQGGED